MPGKLNARQSEPQWVGFNVHANLSAVHHAHCSFTTSGADPGPQLRGGAKVNNCMRSAHKKLGHTHFIATTPTILPRTR